MTRQTLQLTPVLYDYILSVSLREPNILTDLRKETAKLENAQMQISPEQGQLMAWLVQLTQARKALELGTYTGYSALTTALAMPQDGKLVACDINEEWTDIAKSYWQKADVAHKIDLRLAPALETLDSLLQQGEAESFDFAFIDADKENYPIYYERVFQLMRVGGLILLDNVLLGGRIVEKDSRSDSVKAMRMLNEKLHRDSRVNLTLLPISDGLTLVQKLN
jgi:predicted O-methyltransferase YrrM